MSLTMTNKPDAAIQEISTMLSYCRPAGSKTEKRFISQFIVPLGVERDAIGNLSKRIGQAPIIWSCHTDTVHWKKGFQDVAVVNDLILLPSNTQSSCLGADDTAGVWLMMEMIRNNVEGLYIFHREEERGGIGSSFLKRTAADTLKQYHFAIALDRKSVGDVITHQMNGRCCSDTFAKSLAAQLGGKFSPSDNGTFTDTANYTDHIGECTNISVGYEHQHTKLERLNVDFLQRLRDKLCQIDVSKLERKRAPGEFDPDDHLWGFNGHGKTYHPVMTTNHKHWYQDSKGEVIKAVETTESSKYNWIDDYYAERDHLDDRLNMAGLVQRYPQVAADMLEQCGFTEDDIRDTIRELGL